MEKLHFSAIFSRDHSLGSWVSRGNCGSNSGDGDSILIQPCVGYGCQICWVVTSFKALNAGLSTNSFPCGWVLHYSRKSWWSCWEFWFFTKNCLCMIFQTWPYLITKALPGRPHRENCQSLHSRLVAQQVHSKGSYPTILLYIFAFLG